MNRGIMKGIISLGLLCLFFVCSVNSTGSIAKNQLHSLSRAAEQCTVQCTTSSGSNPDSKNWLVEIDVGIYLVYNAELNYFGIYNAKLQIVIVFELIANSRTMIVVNIKTGAAILINIDTSLALFIKGSGAIDFSTDVYGGFEIVFKIIVDNKTKVQGDHDKNTGFYFDITIIFSGNLDAAFEGRKDLGEAIKAEFNVYFNTIVILIQNKVVGAGIGISILFAPVFGLTKESSEFTLGLFVLIQFTVSYRQINVEFMEIIFKVTVKGDKTVISLLVGNIEAIGVIYPNLDAALKGYENNVSISITRVTRKVGDQTITFTFYVYKNSWYIVMESNNSRVTIMYVDELNAFAIYNEQAHLFLVILINQRKCILFSTSTGAGLSLKWGLLGVTASYIERSKVFVQYFVSGSINFSGAITYAQKQSSGGYHFDFNGFIRSIGNDAALKRLFASNVSILAKLRVDFEAVFVYVEQDSKSNRNGNFYVVEIVFGVQFKGNILIKCFQEVFRFLLTFGAFTVNVMIFVFNYVLKIVESGFTVIENIFVQLQSVVTGKGTYKFSVSGSIKFGAFIV